MLEIVAAAVLAGGLGWLGPRAIAALPEPPVDPLDDEAVDEGPVDDEAPPTPPAEDPKPLYVDVAAAPGLAWWFAGVCAVLGGLVGASVPAALLPAWVVFVVGGTWLAYVDARTRLLPFLMTVPLHAACLLLVLGAAVATLDWRLGVRAVLANVGVFAVFWLIWLLGRRFGGGAFGYGDVRLAAVVGLVLGAIGVQEAVIGTYAAFLLGAVGGILLSLARLVDPKAFAFGPYLVLGAVGTAVVVPFL